MNKVQKWISLEAKQHELRSRLNPTNARNTVMKIGALNQAQQKIYRDMSLEERETLIDFLNDYVRV